MARRTTSMTPAPHTPHLDQQGLDLLTYLVERMRRLGTRTPPEDSVPYGTALVDLGYTAAGHGTAGMALLENGLGNLNDWTITHGHPAVCGLVVIGSTRGGYPSSGYFTSRNLAPLGDDNGNRFGSSTRVDASMLWWLNELIRARAFPWDPLLAAEQAHVLASPVSALVPAVPALPSLAVPPVASTVPISEEPLTTEEDTRKYGGGGEGDAHLALKRYIAHHPEVLGFGSASSVTIEHRFLTGNRVDLLVTLGDGRDLSVEVEDDIPLPGGHQAVMYAILRRLERGLATDSDQVLPILVAHRMTAEAQVFCGKYGVTSRVISRRDLKSALRSDPNDDVP